MKVDLGDVPCHGYESQQVDFAAIHPNLAQDIHDELEGTIETAVSVEAFPDANRFCVVIILGHADRVDTAGLTSEQRRAQELDASQRRAKSAGDWFFDQVSTRLQAQGFPAPPDAPRMRNVDIWTIACGSADLVHLAPGNDESKRKRNRRVHFQGTVFQPG